MNMNLGPVFLLNSGNTLHVRVFFTLICPSCLFKQTVQAMFVVLNAEPYYSTFEHSSPAGCLYGKVPTVHTLRSTDFSLFYLFLKFTQENKILPKQNEF